MGKKDKKDEEGTWTKFWKEFNKNLKMGCYEDDSNRSKLSKLLRFTTTKSEDKEVSLDKYLDRMQESQESIYYMSGDSIEIMKKAPALQIFKKKDVEVLMLSDHLDEPCLQKLADYEGKKFVSIQKADVKLDETEAEKEDAAALDTAQVLFQTALIESGYEIADPSALVSRVYRLMSKELGVDPDAPIKEVEVPEEEEEAEEEDKDDKDDGDDADKEDDAEKDDKPEKKDDEL